MSDEVSVHLGRRVEERSCNECIHARISAEGTYCTKFRDMVEDTGEECVLFEKGN